MPRFDSSDTRRNGLQPPAKHFTGRLPCLSPCLCPGLVERTSSCRPSIADLTISHAMLAETALLYLLCPLVYKHPEQSAFWNYSAREWPHHARLGTSPSVQRLALILLDAKRDPYLHWNWGRPRDHQKTSSDNNILLRTPLAHASSLDLPWAIRPIVANLTDEGKAIDLCDSLFIATTCRNLDIAQILLELGADVNANVGPEWNSTTCLAEAVSNGYTAIVRLLLQCRHSFAFFSGPLC